MFYYEINMLIYKKYIWGLNVTAWKLQFGSLPNFSVEISLFRSYFFIQNICHRSRLHHNISEVISFILKKPHPKTQVYRESINCFCLKAIKNYRLRYTIAWNCHFIYFNYSLFFINPYVVKECSFLVYFFRIFCPFVQTS